MGDAMRHSVWGLGLLLLAVWAGPATADDKDSQPNWFSRVFGGGKSSRPEPKKGDNAAKPRADAATAKARIAGAKTTYFRRLEVCDKLKQVAVQTGDDTLLRRAEQLEVRVWDTYQAQLKRVAQNRATLSPEEQTLDDHLGIDAQGTSRRTTVPPGGDAIRTVPGSGLAGRR